MYTKAVKDKAELFRPPKETCIYTLKVKCDIFSLESLDIDCLDNLILRNSFKVTVKSILNKIYTFLKVHIPLYSVNYSVSVYYVLFSVI